VDDQQQNHTSREPNRVPALLTIDHPLDVGDGARIVENPRGNLERNAMLSPVNPILLRIPKENRCICNTVSQSGAWGCD
jgi:hypothetical protein